MAGVKEASRDDEGSRRKAASAALATTVAFVSACSAADGSNSYTDSHRRQKPRRGGVAERGRGKGGVSRIGDSRFRRLR